MKRVLLESVCLLLMAVSVRADLPTISNGSFEADSLAVGGQASEFSDWFHRTAWCFLSEESADDLPETPYGSNWVEFGNLSWAYQQIGTWSADLTLDISLLIGSKAGRDFPGLHISLWVGGDPNLAASGDPGIPLTTLEAEVGATQIAITDLIQPGALTEDTAKSLEQMVTVSTGTGHVEGDPLWLLIQSAGRQRVLIDNIVMNVLTGDPQPIDPVPATGAMGADPRGTLHWTVANISNPTYAVNIGTTEACDDVLVDENTVTATFYAPPKGLLTYATHYYWRIDVTDRGALFPGTVWEFTTEPFSFPTDVMTVSASSSLNNNTGPEKTIQGIGLNANNQHNTELTDMWIGMEVEGNPPWIQYDFAKVQKFDRVHIWNSNTLTESVFGLGVKEALFEVSLDGETWNELATIELARGPGASDYAGVDVSLSGTVAKSVRITAKSGWGGLSQAGLSEVLFFTLPLRARLPEPADGAADVDLTGRLAWRPGRETDQHKVYLESDRDSLVSGAPVGTTPENQFDLGGLDLQLGQTYFWRIDEVNEIRGPRSWEGDVWHFSTPMSLTVDNMESYRDKEFEEIWATWVDGYNNPDNGAVVGNGVTGAPETDIVHGGKQAMPLRYDNGTSPSSFVTRTFSEAQNWTAHGVQTLSLYIHGDPANQGQLVIKINDVKVAYQSLSDALQRQQWVLYAVDLTGLTIDLGAVTKLSIGVEGNSASGTLYVDDIALYALPLTLIDPENPGADDPNLVAYYEFEGNANDSTGVHHAESMGAPQYTAGKIGQAINFGGFEDYVVAPFAGEETWSACAVSLWVKTDIFGQALWSGVFNNNSSGADFQFEVDGTDPGFYRYNGARDDNFGPVTSEWTHLVMSCDGTQTTLYYNGLFVTSLNTVDTQFGQIALGANRNSATLFAGEVDEVRVFNRALSAAEIAGLAGIEEAFPSSF